MYSVCLTHFSTITHTTKCPKYQCISVVSGGEEGVCYNLLTETEESGDSIVDVCGEGRELWQ